MAAAKQLLRQYFTLFVMSLILLPSLAATYLLISETRTDITFTQKEVAGVRYHRALFDVMMAYHRLVDMTLLHAPSDTELATAREALKKAIVVLDNAAADGELLRVQEKWRQLRAKLLTAASNTDIGKPAEQAQALAECSKAILKLMDKVTNQSNLILDPELESYYLMSVLTMSAPSAVHELGTLFSEFSARLAAGDVADATRHAEREIGRIQMVMETYTSRVDILSYNDPEMVAQETESNFQSLNKFRTVVQELEDILQRPSMAKLVQINDSRDRALESVAGVYGVLSGHLEWHLEERLDAERIYRNQVLLLIGLSLLLTCVIFWFARRNVVRQEKLDAAEKVKVVLETVVDAIITIDDRGHINAFNPAAEKMFGYAKHEVAGRNIRMLMPEPYRSAHDGYLAAYHQTGRAKVIGKGRETLGLRKNGEEFPIELAVNPFEANGKRVYVGSIRDISGRKQVEASLQQYATTLEVKNLELDKARNEADAANVTKTEFLATVSHEIRTPMNGIIGMTDLLLNTELDAKQLNYAMTVMGSARALLALINDILDFSKNEAGKLDLEVIPFSLHQQVQEVTQLLNLKAIEKNVTLTWDYQPDMPKEFMGDPTRIRQLLTNLIDNAIKFTQDGSVRVDVRTESREGPQALVRVTVSDSGIGIPKEVQHKLFTKFSQADATTTRKYGGTGLGLAICKQLAEMMGGAIGFSSEVGKGSQFWFTMKLDVSEDTVCILPGPAEATQGQAADLRGLKVLLAEDNHVNQFYATELLGNFGIETVVVENGKDAIVRLEREAFDLIFMDCQMPVMDGYEATGILRARMAAGELPTIPIIAMTANAMRGDREKCLDAGMHDYVAKPLERDELVRLMQLWVKRKA